MQTPLETLGKILKLEIEKKYDNHAIIGGMGKILPAWQTEAKKYHIDDSLIATITQEISKYSSSDQSTRELIVYGLLELISSNHSSIDSHQSASSLKEPIAQNSSSKPSPVISHVVRGSLNPVLKTESQPVALNASLTVISGIGKSRADDLKILNLRTLGDLLYFFPRRYDDYTQLKPINRIAFGEVLSVIGSVENVNERNLKEGSTHRGIKHITEIVITDGTGALRLTWFNQPYIVKQLPVGTQIVVSGKVDSYLGRLVMNSPDWEPIDSENLHTNRIVPVYALTTNIGQKWLRRTIFQTVNHWASRVADFIPAEILSETELVTLSTALRQIHFPDSQQALAAARNRLAFDEIFLLQVGAQQQKKDWKSAPAVVYQVTNQWMEDRKKALPYQLTSAQEKALADIRTDLASGKPMNRLLQGDVGSGKTVLAAIAMEIVIKDKAQSAILAPTSILAGQHYQTLVKLLADDQNPNPIKSEEIALLTGDVNEKDKAILRDQLRDGSIKIVVGTHALLEDLIEFNNLQLAIIDEQHRFGVEQRSRLRAKGNNPHLLVMTATPIPRSLALTIYGDLDLSILDEMPPGRQPVETHLLMPAERERAYHLIQKLVLQKQQAFIIYPLIEKGEDDEAKAAVEEFERLKQDIFPSYSLGLLHGRLKPDEKDQVMDLFRKNEIQVLISTSVVEVGVDIPNASLMLIEGANRFGLAQLHQFRGRVGRGYEKSYCLLIPETDDAIENERLIAMTETNDGFVLAEKDLSQRGPGEFLGTRQSGYSGLKLASLTDLKTIEKARNAALKIFSIDPDLTDPQHKSLKEALVDFWSPGKGDIS